MPFLRRRGIMASENDMRRHTFFAPTTSNTSTTSEHSPQLPQLSQPPSQIEQPDVDGDVDGDVGNGGEPVSQQSTRESPATSPSRPESPPIQEENSKHRRFSVLRFRNASDSQLSVRAKQQAEKPPPVPRRNLPTSHGLLTDSPFS